MGSYFFSNKRLFDISEVEYIPEMQIGLRGLTLQTTAIWTISGINGNLEYFPTENSESEVMQD